jgi:hypothetical protein
MLNTNKNSLISYLGRSRIVLGYFSMTRVWAQMPVRSRQAGVQADPLARVYGVFGAPAHSVCAKLIDKSTVYRPQNVVLVVVPAIERRERS